MSPSSMYHRSARPPFFLQRVPRVFGSREFLWATKLEVGSFLQYDCVLWLQGAVILKGHRHQSTEGCLTRAEQPHVLEFRPQPSQSQAALQGSIDISTSIFGHRRQPLLLNMRLVSLDVSTPPPPCA